MYKVYNIEQELASLGVSEGFYKKLLQLEQFMCGQI